MGWSDDDDGDEDHHDADHYHLHFITITCEGLHNLGMSKQWRREFPVWKKNIIQVIRLIKMENKEGSDTEGDGNKAKGRR